MKSTCKKTSVATARKICVIFPGALGDFICFLPTLKLLGRHAEVDLYAQSAFGDIAPKGVATAPLERAEIHKLFTAEGDDDKQRAFFAGYGAIYSWFGSQQPDFVRRLCAASSGRAQLFSFHPPAAGLHQIDYYLSCLNETQVTECQPEIALRPEAVRWRAEFWRKHGLERRPALALAAGSGAREKNWPEDSFIAVAEWWRRTAGGAVVLLVGPVEEERRTIDRLCDHGVVASGLSLSQVAALIEACDLYLGNDSGTSHMAAALGVRTVVLFGPSNAERWLPRGKKVTLLRRDLQCSPCDFAIMKSCRHHSCLTALYPEEVIDTLAHLPEVLTLTRQEPGIRV